MIHRSLISLVDGFQDLTLPEAETIALSILKQVMEEKVKLYSSFCMNNITWWCSNFDMTTLIDLLYCLQVTPNNVDIAKVAPTYHLYTPAEVEAVISRL